MRRVRLGRLVVHAAAHILLTIREHDVYRCIISGDIPGLSAFRFDLNPDVIGVVKHRRIHTVGQYLERGIARPRTTAQVEVIGRPGRDLHAVQPIPYSKEIRAAIARFSVLCFDLNPALRAV